MTTSTTRVLLRIAPTFVAPDHVQHVRYLSSLSLCTCEVRLQLLPQLRQHPGVLGLSLPSCSRIVRAPAAGVDD